MNIQLEDAVVMRLQQILANLTQSVSDNDDRFNTQIDNLNKIIIQKDQYILQLQQNNKSLRRQLTGIKTKQSTEKQTKKIFLHKKQRNNIKEFDIGVRTQNEEIIEEPVEQNRILQRNLSFQFLSNNYQRLAKMSENMVQNVRREADSLESQKKSLSKYPQTRFLKTIDVLSPIQNKTRNVSINPFPSEKRKGKQNQRPYFKRNSSKQSLKVRTRKEVQAKTEAKKLLDIGVPIRRISFALARQNR